MCKDKVKNKAGKAKKSTARAKSKRSKRPKVEFAVDVIEEPRKSKARPRKVDEEKLRANYTEWDFIGDPLWEWVGWGEGIKSIEEETDPRWREIRREDHAFTRVNWKVLADQGSDWEPVWLQALDGDDEALFQLLRVFKELAGAQWVLNRLAARAREKDRDFVVAFGQALAEKLSFHANTDARLIEYIVPNWTRPDNPLSEMNENQIMYDLKRVGLHKGPVEDSDKVNLRKQLSRLNLARRKGCV